MYSIEIAIDDFLSVTRLLKNFTTVVEQRAVYVIH